MNTLDRIPVGARLQALNRVLIARFIPVEDGLYAAKYAECLWAQQAE